MWRVSRVRKEVNVSKSEYAQVTVLKDKHTMHSKCLTLCNVKRHFRILVRV